MAISGVNFNGYQVNGNPYVANTKKPNEINSVNKPVVAKDNADSSKLLNQKHEKNPLTDQEFEKIKKEMQEIDKTPKSEVVLDRRNGFVTKIKNQNDDYKGFIKDKDGNLQADLVHLKALKADGYFQPMQDFVNKIDGLSEKDKYILNKAVLTSMENSGTSRDLSKFKSAQLEQSRTELNMIADKIVPDNYRKEFKDRANAYVDQVYKDYVKKIDFASKEENRKFIQKDFLNKIDALNFDKSSVEKYKADFEPVNKLIKEGSYLEAKEKLNSIYKEMFKVGTNDFSLNGMEDFVVSPTVRKMQESWNVALTMLNSNFNMHNNFSDMFFSTYFNARG